MVCGIVQIAGEQARALDQQFAIVANADLDAGQRLADAAGLGTVERVERDHAAFGQAVAFDQRHADGFVELRQVLAERGGAGGRDLQPSAETRADFAEEQAVGNGQRHANAQRNRLAFAAVARGGQRQAERAVERLARGRGPLAQLRADGGVDALPHARRRQQDGRPHLADILRQLQQALGERHRHAAAHRQQLDHDALRDVRRGQERDGANRPARAAARPAPCRGWPRRPGG